MATRRRQIVWTRRARDGLDDAVGYIAKDSPQSALELLEQALAMAQSLERLTERGRMVPELRDSSVRELLVGRYRLVYEVTTSRAVVLGFLHCARDFNRWWRGE